MPDVLLTVSLSPPADHILTMWKQEMRFGESFNTLPLDYYSGDYDYLNVSDEEDDEDSIAAERGEGDAAVTKKEVVTTSVEHVTAKLLPKRKKRNAIGEHQKTKKVEPRTQTKFQEMIQNSGLAMMCIPGYPNSDQPLDHPKPEAKSKHPSGQRKPEQPQGHRKPEQPQGHRKPGKPQSHRKPEQPQGHRKPEKPQQGLGDLAADNDEGNACRPGRDDDKASNGGAANDDNSRNASGSVLGAEGTARRRGQPVKCILKLSPSPSQTLDRHESPPLSQTPVQEKIRPLLQTLGLFRTPPFSLTLDRQKPTPPSKIRVQKKTPPPLQTLDLFKTSPSSQTLDRYKTHPPFQILGQQKSTLPSQTPVQEKIPPPLQTQDLFKTSPASQTLNRQKTRPPSKPKHPLDHRNVEHPKVDLKSSQAPGQKKQLPGYKTHVHPPEGKQNVFTVTDLLTYWVGGIDALGNVVSDDDEGNAVSPLHADGGASKGGPRNEDNRRNTGGAEGTASGRGQPVEGFLKLAPMSSQNTDQHKTVPPSQTLDQHKTPPVSQTLDQHESLPLYQTPVQEKSGPSLQTLGLFRTPPPSLTLDRHKTHLSFQTLDRQKSTPPSQTPVQEKIPPPLQTQDLFKTPPPSQTLNRQKTHPPSKLKHPLDHRNVEHPKGDFISSQAPGQKKRQPGYKEPVHPPEGKQNVLTVTDILTYWVGGIDALGNVVSDDDEGNVGSPLHADGGASKGGPRNDDNRRNAGGAKGTASGRGQPVEGFLKLAPMSSQNTDQHKTVPPSQTVDQHESPPLSQTPVQEKRGPSLKTMGLFRTPPPSLTLDRHKTHLPSQTLDRQKPTLPSKIQVQEKIYPPLQTLDLFWTSPSSQTLDWHKTHPPSQTLDRHKTHPPFQILDRIKSTPPSQTPVQEKIPPPLQTQDLFKTPPPSQTLNRQKTPPPYQTLNRQKTPPPSQALNRQKTPPPSQALNRQKTPPPSKQKHPLDHRNVEHPKVDLNSSQVPGQKKRQPGYKEPVHPPEGKRNVLTVTDLLTYWVGGIDALGNVVSDDDEGNVGSPLHADDGASKGGPRNDDNRRNAGGAEGTASGRGQPVKGFLKPALPRSQTLDQHKTPPASQTLDQDKPPPPSQTKHSSDQRKSEHPKVLRKSNQPSGQTNQPSGQTKQRSGFKKPAAEENLTVTDLLTYWVGGIDPLGNIVSDDDEGDAGSPGRDERGIARGNVGAEAVASGRGQPIKNTLKLAPLPSQTLDRGKTIPPSQTLDRYNTPPSSQTLDRQTAPPPSQTPTPLARSALTPSHQTPTVTPSEELMPSSPLQAAAINEGSAQQSPPVRRYSRVVGTPGWRQTRESLTELQRHRRRRRWQQLAAQEPQRHQSDSSSD